LNKHPSTNRLIVNVVGMALLLAPLAAPADGVPVREGLRLWLDASDAGTLDVCSNAVTRWRDKSGANNHARAVGAPVVLERDFNGHPAVRLSGHASFQLSPVVGKTGPITVFIVSRRTPTQAGGAGWQRLVSIRSGTAADNKPPNFCLSAEAKSDAYAPSVKVMSKDDIAPGAVAIGGVGGSNPPSQCLKGDIAEVLIYDRGFVSEGALREVLDYLAAKWGATVDRQNSGWTRTGDLGATPQLADPSLPLADQLNRGGWAPFEPFSDEFNAATLDTQKWEPMRAWKGRPPGLFRSSNVALTNGCLALTMRKETVPEMKNDPRYHDYTSAILESTRYTRYGYFEIRARPMNSAGSSSFWFAGGAKAWRIEIDVFEIGGKAPHRERAYNMNAHVFRKNGIDDHWNTGGVWQAPWRLADGFHVYGLEWSPQQLVYHVDGVVVRSLPNTHWHEAMRLIFDSETMPDWFGLPNDEDLPSTFQVDYVRAWKRPGWDGVIGQEELDAKSWEPLK
jgi:beta-glucanase (GH16 family)